MTLAPPHTPPPSGRTQSAKPRPARKRGPGQVVLGWWFAGLGAVARWPWWAAAAGLAIVATTPVTLRHLAGFVVAVAGICGVIFLAGSNRARFEILPRMSRYRKRRRRIRSRWVAVMTDAGLVKSPVVAGISARMPRIRRTWPTRTGVGLTVSTAAVGSGGAALRAKADVLRNGWRARDVKVTDLRPGTVRIDVRYIDVFRRIVPVSSLPRPSAPLHVVTGIDEDNNGVEKHLALPNLIVGAQGSGKSSEVWTLLHALQRSGIPHRVRVFDPKGGQEFGDLDGAAWRYEREPTSWGKFVQTALEALKVRQDILRKRGLRTNPFTAEFPLDVMLVDELVTALAFDRTKVKIGGVQLSTSEAFGVFLSQGRSAGFTVVALSQLAEKAVIGPIRPLFSYVTCLRVGPTETEIVDMCLGSSAHKAYPAHELPADGSAAGVGWMRTERGVVKYRAALLTEAQRRGVVRRMAADTAGQQPEPEEES